ncbi:anaerobic sulfatase maturase [Romboutsia lituseburensis]|uniref:anaerobic sulfatase maturase n=1 Tax=Romboutsia lituseburensis TaxID=1537 RepID=UPI0022EAA5A6|nr:anaerobic sulfatase maturase [Romboutsia lituseburensis]
MSDLTLLIKPSSSECNLNCEYCFYKDVAINRSVYKNRFMNLDTLENIIRKALSEDISSCNFMFQGGEPTLIGIEFYKNAILFQKKYNNRNITIINSIQTNGINIDTDFALFFKQNNFLVGVSLDGPKKINDFHRNTLNNLSSFDKVLNGIELLKKHEVQFNILCVITKKSSKHIDEIYSFYKNMKFKYIQFIPCIKKFDTYYLNSNELYYLNSDDYYNFLDKLFNLWFYDLVHGNFIEIRNFLDYISVLKGYEPTSCGMGGFCSLHTVIESSGDVYPCDFYCIDEWKLGNINNDTLIDIKCSDICKIFFQRSLYIHDECKICKYFKLCGGGCRRNLEPFINNKPSFNYQCSAIKIFFNKNIDKLYLASNLFN